MISTRPARPIATSSIAGTLVLTALVLVVTCAVSIAFALANQPYFDLWDGLFHPTDAVVRALFFSSFPLLLATPIVARWPTQTGLGVGDTLRQWPVILATTGLAMLGTAVILRVTGATPYSDASLFVESVLVPLTEELLFRGVVLAALLIATRSLYAERTAVPLAIAINGLAFGLAHLANATDIAASFVIGQAAFAVVLGGICAWLAVRTRSVLPAMLLHGAVNAVVVLI